MEAALAWAIVSEHLYIVDQALAKYSPTASVSRDDLWPYAVEACFRAVRNAPYWTRSLLRVAAARGAIDGLRQLTHEGALTIIPEAFIAIEGTEEEMPDGRLIEELMREEEDYLHVENLAVIGKDPAMLLEYADWTGRDVAAWLGLHESTISQRKRYRRLKGLDLHGGEGDRPDG